MTIAIETIQLAQEAILRQQIELEERLDSHPDCSRAVVWRHRMQQLQFASTELADIFLCLRNGGVLPLIANAPKRGFTQ